MGPPQPRPDLEGRGDQGHRAEEDMGDQQRIVRGERWKRLQPGLGRIQGQIRRQGVHHEDHRDGPAGPPRAGASNGVRGRSRGSAGRAVGGLSSSVDMAFSLVRTAARHTGAARRIGGGVNPPVSAVPSPPEAAEQPDQAVGRTPARWPRPRRLRVPQGLGEQGRTPLGGCQQPAPPVRGVAASGHAATVVRVRPAAPAGRGRSGRPGSRSRRPATAGRRPR